MIEEITPNNFEHVLNNVPEGYLVNVWLGIRSAIAHNLAHLNGECRSTLSLNDTYPKFFAATFEDARRHAHEHFDVHCTACQRCGK